MSNENTPTRLTPDEGNFSKTKSQASNYYGTEPLRLAQAYVPIQQYGITFNPAEALAKGTLFPELYRPYPY